MEGGLLSQLKYLIFFAFVLTAVPIGIKMAKKNIFVEKAVFFLLLFFTTKEITINFVSRETFRITTRGFEISLVDCLLMILFALVMERRSSFKIHKPKGWVLFSLYFLFSLMSVVNSESYLFSAFELSKMIRMYFFLWVVYNYVNSQDQFADLMNYIAIIIIFIFLTVIKQKYIDGVFQTPGPFPHQNSLVMYMIIFNSLVLSYLLNNPKVNFAFWGVVFAMGGVVIISTLSRAGMALFGLSAVFIFFASIVSKFSFKKIIILFFAVIAAAGILYKAMDTIIERFQTAPEESTEVRVLLAEAAVKMANDKTLGIGLNNFGIKINPPYKYGDHIEHKEGEEDVKNGLVETIYLMIAAETGWHNLLVFILWLLSMFYLNIKNLFRFKKSTLLFFPIGVAGGLMAIYIESTLEWVLKQTHNFYQLMLIFALIGAMDKIWKRGFERDEK